MLAIAIFAGCGAKKTIPQHGDTQLSNTVGFVKKVYPGVSGAVQYFVQYRIEFDLKTQGEVQFQYVIVNGDTLPVSSVRVGNKIINTSRGEHLSEDAKDVRIAATKPVKHMGTDIEIHSRSTQKMVLFYTTKEGTHQKVIEDIRHEENEYRPSVGPSPGRE